MISKSKLTFHLISILPGACEGYLGESVIARAVRRGLIAIKLWNPRDAVKAGPSGRRTVDDRAYGGGPGMVLQAEPILKTVEKVKGQISKVKSKSQAANRRIKVIILSPSGKQFDNQLARKLAKSGQDLVLIAGRYEGVDARVKKILRAEEVSIGPYILSGGELPALVMIEAIARQIPGVLGKFESVEENRIASSEVYTRPEVLKYDGKNHRVPKVLLSGHHGKIDEWRLNRKQR